jgi:hypothetical protein
LQSLPNIPHIPFNAEDVYEDPKCRKHLLTLLSKIFQLPLLDPKWFQFPMKTLLQHQKQKHFPFILTKRSLSAPPRLLQEKFPHFQRVSLPKSQKQNRMETSRSLSTISQRFQQIRSMEQFPNQYLPNSYQYHWPTSSLVKNNHSLSNSSFSSSKQQKQQQHPQSQRKIPGRWLSPEPKQRQQIPIPIDSYPLSIDNNNHKNNKSKKQRSKSPLQNHIHFNNNNNNNSNKNSPYHSPNRNASPSSHSHSHNNNNINKANNLKVFSDTTTKKNVIVTEQQQIRSIEMQRERLQVQRNEHRRRHSKLLAQLAAEQQQQRHNNNNNNNNKSTVLSYRSDSRNRRMIDPLNNNNNNNKDDNVSRRSGDRQSVSKSQQAPPPPPTNTTTATNTANNITLANQQKQQPSKPPPSNNNNNNHQNHLLRDDWKAPKLSLQQIELLTKEQPPFESITITQQMTIKDWLLSQGINIYDGEGNFHWINNNNHSNNNNNNNIHYYHDQKILSLFEDRLRNGLILCEILCHCEPFLAQQAQLDSILYYYHNLPPTSTTSSSNNNNNNHHHPALKTFPQIELFIEKLLWIIRIKYCPQEIPLQYCIQPKLIIEGHKDCLWGLLYYLMQYYQRTLYNTNQSTISNNNSNNNNNNNSNNNHNQVVSSNKRLLSYSPAERKALDQSLLDWLESLHILEEIIGSGLGRPATILALQSYCRDGTLFYAIIHKIGLLQRSHIPKHLLQIQKQVYSYAQCIANLTKCITILRNFKNQKYPKTNNDSIHQINASPPIIKMPKRMLYEGVEEDLARGAWDVTLGLLEDLHFLHDNLIFVSSSTFDHHQLHYLHHASQPQYPYLGTKTQRLFSSISTMNALEALEESKTPTLVSSKESIQEKNKIQNTLRTSQENQNNQEIGDELYSGMMPGTSRKSQSVQLENEYHFNQNHNNNNNNMSIPKLNTSAEVDEHHLHHLPKGILSSSSLPSSMTATTTFKPSLDLRDHLLYESEQETILQTMSKQPTILPSAHQMTSFDPALPSFQSESTLPMHTVPQWIAELQQQQQKDSLQPRAVLPSASVTEEDIDDDNDVEDDSELAHREESGNSARNIKQNYRNNNNSNTDRKINTRKSTSLAVHFTSDEDDEEVNEDQSSQPLQPSHQAALLPPNSKLSTLRWVSETLNIPLQALRGIQQLGELFKDGVCLARLVSKLERRELPGIELRPKSAAQRFQNIRRSLEFLAEYNRRIPLRTLSIEEEIYEGDAQCILQLLETLRKAYPHHIP